MMAPSWPTTSPLRSRWPLRWSSWSACRYGAVGELLSPLEGVSLLSWASLGTAVLLLGRGRVWGAGSFRL